MSKAKMVPINREKIEAGLKAKKMTKTDLAKKIDVTPNWLYHALKRGYISEHKADMIGRCLDLSPKYIEDMTPLEYFFPDLPKNYASHVAQEKKNSPYEITSGILARNGYLPQDLTKEAFWGLYDELNKTVENYLKEYFSNK